MKILVKVISYIIVIALIMMILAGTIITIIKGTVFNKDYVLAKLDETNYYEKIQQSLVIQLEDYVEQSGLNELDISKVITTEQIKKDVDKLFTQIYDGEQIQVNKDEITKELENKLAELNGDKELTAIEKAAVKDIFETITTKYLEEVAYGTYIKYLEPLPRVAKFADNIMPAMQIALYIAIAVEVVMIFVFNFKQIRLGVKYIGIALLSSSIFLIGVKVFTSISMNISNFFILSRSASDLIVNIVSDILNQIMTIGIIGAIIGLAFIIIGATYVKEEEE